LCQSKSGTGKTLVFVITILNSLVIDKKNGEYLTSQAIIIANTRELAHQIFKEFIRMSKYFKKPQLRSACFFGGVSL
jgi:superfamily II DNA/RNA helicase